MQELVWWSIHDLENGEETTHNDTGELVSDLKRAGTTITKVNISNTVCRHGFNHARFKSPPA